MKRVYLSTLLVCVTYSQISIAQQVNLTLTDTAPLHLNLDLNSEKIGILEKGTIVEALSETGLSYQIKAPNGDVGWIPYQYFEESRELIIEYFNDKPVPLFKSLNERRWVGTETIRDLEDREHVTFLEGNELKGFVKIRDQSGVVGFTYWQRARPAIEDSIPKYEQLNYVVILQSQIEAKVLQQPLSELISIVGDPDAQIIDAQGSGFAFFRKLYLVKDGVRYGHIRFTVVENLVTSFGSEKEPKSFWIEKLPLSSWMRGLDFGIEFQQMQGYDLFPSTGEMTFLKKWGWRILWVITLLVFFTLPYHLSKPFTSLYGHWKLLPKGIAMLLSILTCIAFVYVYYLFLGLHMMHDQHWLFIILTVLVGGFGYMVNKRKITYNRCPNQKCRSYNKAELLGSDVVGKTHVTEHKHQDVYRGTRETSTEIIKEYDRHHYTEESTEIDIDDHMQCTICGETWDVGRSKTVSGHV